MTHKDTTMLEQLTEVICEKRMDAAYEGCVNPCASLPCLCAQNIARAILNELKTPSEGMVEAAQWAIEKNIARGVGYQAVSLGLISALDHVLNEGEG